jgi:hypothetical protein
MPTPEQLSVESDPRFPSGRWTGYFLQPMVPGRHQMELHLTFHDGIMTGEGRDRVGQFAMDGAYTLEDGRCQFIKQYLGRHRVYYAGFNEGKGIWGTWDIPDGKNYVAQRGGFHIWPEGMGDPTNQTLSEEADLPMEESVSAGEVLVERD